MKKLLKISKTGCPPCDTLEKILQEKGVEYENVLMDEKLEVAIKYQVRKVPTLIYLKDDVEVSRVVGLSEVESLLEKYNNG